MASLSTARAASRPYSYAFALGLAGLALNQAKLPLLGGGTTDLLIGGAPVLAAFALLGTGPGLLCVLVSQSRALFSVETGSLANSVYVLEAWGVFWLYRRHGSLILCMVLYWCSAGWMLDLVAHGWSVSPLRPGLGLRLAAQVFGGVLNAAVAEAALALPPLRSLAASAPADLRRLFLRRTLGLAVPPALVLAVVATRSSIESGAGLRAGIPASPWPILLSFVALVLFLWGAAVYLASELSGPLQRLTSVASDIEAGRPLGGGFEELARNTIAEIEGLASQLARTHEALAYVDPVTGLPNLKLLQDHLSLATAQAARNRESFALLLVDLDHFRVIDNSLGRVRGNALLSQIAQRLKQCVGPGDTVGRVGGDEFALLIPRMGRMEEAAEMALKLMDTVKQPFAIEGREVFVTASVGISLYPRDGADAETLLKNATAATYVAKERGQDTYRRYTARITARDAQRLLIESGLRRALDHGDLVLHYQPIVDLRSGEVEGTEALVRWQRPDVGLVEAGDFIGVAEASGLVSSMDFWVVRRACLQTQAWRDRGYPLRVAVNVSARRFQQADLVEHVGAALRAAGLDPACFEIEITEGVAVQDVERSVETLRALRKLGVSISIDDFGTGYSSLRYLNRLPVDKVKLDQSFVRDVTTNPDDAAIAVAVIAMAHSLKLKVVAEGVETEEQLDFLRRHDCDAIQGFFFSPAVPANDIETLLAQKKRLPIRG